MCLSPTHLKYQVHKDLHGVYYSLYVPCGKCMCCKIAKARENALRVLFELHSYHGVGTFATFTYDDDHLPDRGSLAVSTLQKLHKRIRASFSDRKLKFFSCGEYGDLHGRAHYHAIIFGLPPTDETRDLLQESWPNGHVDVDVVNYFSARYVASYIEKKYFGDKENLEYLSNGLISPFQLQSKGLGRDWFLAHYKQIFAYGMRFRGSHLSLPRYFFKVCEQEGIDITPYRELVYRPPHVPSERELKLRADEFKHSQEKFGKYLKLRQLGGMTKRQMLAIAGYNVKSFEKNEISLDKLFEMCYT